MFKICHLASPTLTIVHQSNYSVCFPEAAEDPASHFTGIMIGTTCGIIFIVLTVLAVAHTRKLRLRRAQLRRTDVASTVSFDHDVHQLNAPPSYVTGECVIRVTAVTRLSIRA